MARKQCAFKNSEGERCSHQNYNLSVYCFWHDPRAKKTQDDIKEKLVALYRAGESLEGFQLKGANLSNIDLSFANLKKANLKRADLSGAHLHGSNFTEASLIKADLKGANLNQANMTYADVLGIQEEKAKMERITWGSLIVQEKRALDAFYHHDFDKASILLIEAEEVYRSLYRAYEDRGLYDEASHFYHRDRIIRRYQLEFPSKDWVLSYMVDLLCGYGEKPLRVIFFSMFIILFWALVYANIGVVYSDQTLAFSMNKTFSYNLFVLLHCLYFSVVTFTTLGYGDITPLGLAKFFAAFEAFVGSFTIAIFVVVFVKKMTR